MSSSDPSQQGENTPPTKRGKIRRALTPQEIAAQFTPAAPPIEEPPAPAPVPAPPQSIDPPRIDSTRIDAPPIDLPQPANQPAPEPAARPNRLPDARFLLRFAGLGLLFLFAFSSFLGWGTLYPESELDSSWYMVLHWAFKTGAQFGKDLIFTYGPLGFLFQGYAPWSVSLVVIAWAAVAAMVVVALERIARASAWPRAIQWSWLAAVLLLMSSGAPMMNDERLFIACWLIVLVHFFIDPRSISVLKVAIVIVMAAISLGKFSMAMVSAVAMGLVTVDLLYRRKIPWLTAIWFAAMVLFWVMAGQSLANVPAYIRYAMQVASGYGQAVGSSSETEARDLSLFLLSSALFIGVIAYCQYRELRRAKEAGEASSPHQLRARAVLVVAGLFPIVILLLKMGYIRQDSHEIIATSTLAILCLLYFAVQWPRSNEKLARCLLVATPLITVGLAAFSYLIWLPRDLLPSFAENFRAVPKRSWVIVKGAMGDAQLNRAYEKMLWEFREHRTLPKGAGSYDGFSFIQRSLLATGLEYHPRPVFQGYLAYTPELSKLNAAFYESDAAAPHVLLDLQQIDHIMPSQLEASVWPALLGQYRVKQVLNGASVFDRDPSARPAVLKWRSEVTVTMGQWAKAPELTNPLWMSMDLTRTPAGVIVEALYKPPSLRLELKLRSGDQALYGLIPRTAGEGFLVSPSLHDRRSFAVLYSNQWKELLRDEIVDEFRIVPENEKGSTYAYSPQYTVKFYDLEYPKFDLSATPGFADMLRISWMKRHLRPVRGTKIPEAIEDGHGSSVLVAGPPSQFAVEVPPGSKVLRVGFGVLLDTYDDFVQLPVTFRVYAGRDSNGKIQASVIWTRIIDPRIREQRGIQYQDIPLPDPPMPLIVLETTRGNSQGSGPSYWEEVGFR